MTSSEAFYDAIANGQPVATIPADAQIFSKDMWPVPSPSHPLGQSALHIASEKGHVDVVRALLNKGVDVNLIDKNGKSALHLAMENRNDDVVCALLGEGLKLHLTDSERLSALHIVTEKGNADAVRALLDAGVNASLVDNAGQSILHKASKIGNAEIVHAVLDKGVDVNLTDNFGRSPLHIASQTESVDVVHALLDKGVTVSLADKLGQSALHIASEKGHVDSVRALLDKGVDVSLIDENGKSALHLAMENRNDDVVCALLGEGVKLNLTDSAGETALSLASERGYTGVVHFLLNSGADVNFIDSNHRYAVHVASEKGHVDIVRALLDKGADVNQIGSFCQSPLHRAARHGHKEVVCALLNKGADVNSANKSGNTPLHKAAAGGLAEESTYIAIMKKLLKHGANPTAQNEKGRTPAKVAFTDAGRKLLKAAEAEYKVAHLQKGKPRVVRLAVLGDEAVGKTQFIQTATSKSVTAYVRSLKNPPAEGSDKYIAQRTPGVRLMEMELSDRRIVRVLDMGGQPQFIGSHRPIVVTGFGMYLLVLNLLAGLDGMLTSGKYWLRFIISTRDPAMFLDSPPPPLFLLFSHADLMTSKNPQHLAGEVYAHLSDEFSKYFDWMPANPYVSNCRVRSVDINRLLADLCEAHEKVAKAMPLEPLINDQIRKALHTRKQSAATAGGILRLNEYYDFVREHVSVSDKDLPSLTTLLDMQADVMLFDSKEKDKDVTSYVVVDPHHVCHHMLKAVLSPRHFKGSKLVFPPHGVIEGLKLDKALINAGVDPKAGRGLLHFAQISVANPRQPDSDFFAIHVAADSGTWKDDGVTKPQSGVQLHCPDVPVSPAFLPALLLALSNKTGGIDEDSIIWKTGIVVSWENKVIVMAQQVAGGFDVNITARADPDHSHDCAEALAGVTDITLKTAKSASPGSEMMVRYLSPSQVAAGRELTAAFTAEKVITHYKQKRRLLHGSGADDPDKVMDVLRAVQPHLCPKEDETNITAQSPAVECTQGSSVEGARPESTDGRALKEDDVVLFDIADELAFDIHHLKRFAALLLDGSGCRKSGAVFLAGLSPDEHTSVPSMTHALLKYWIESAPAPTYTRYGRQLKLVLEHIEKGSVVRRFQNYLSC